MTKARTLADNFAADISGITAGTGITGGGTSGTVTITNDMATTIAAKGDLVAGTANDAYAALTVGANNTVLTADSTAATGLKWATPTSGSMTLLSTTSLAGVTTATVSSISQSYTHLEILIEDFDFNTNDKAPALRLNGDTGSNYYQEVGLGNRDTFNTYFDCFSGSNLNEGGMIYFRIPFYSNSAISKVALQQQTFISSTGSTWYRVGGTFGSWKATPAAITSITVFNRTDTTNFDAGSIKIYGVN